MVGNRNSSFWDACWVLKLFFFLILSFFFSVELKIFFSSYPPFFDDHPFGIYEKILAGKIAFPNHFDSNAKDLIKKLLNPDRARRLGVLKGGADEVKKQKYFKGLDWEKLGKTPGPILPPVRHDGDTQNFELYSEPIEDILDKDDPYGHLFQDFWENQKQKKKINEKNLNYSFESRQRD